MSLADLLRNAFVYPPHSIYHEVKVAISGFEPEQDLHGEPRFRSPHQLAGAIARPLIGEIDREKTVMRYHRLLCEAIAASVNGMKAPWLLQSGGKDSTSMAIALAEVRPDATCVTYLGGIEEDEVDSARFVAQRLGLRHEVLVCDSGRAYDRYLAMMPAMPLLTADFATLSYADLASTVAAVGGDGVIDALGSDPYFGMPTGWRQRLKALLAWHLPLPHALLESAPVAASFRMSYALGTMQMDRFERFFPGSRFTDAEVDALFGRPVAASSRQRLRLFRDAVLAAPTMQARRCLAAVILEAATFGKGLYIAGALDLKLAYPYCDEPLRQWIFREVPDALLIGPGGINKVLVREHIARHFQRLPYVKDKGCFRFDLVDLARKRFDQVHAFAVDTKTQLPGATDWLERHRDRLDNKYFASKFYLLAIILPWLLARAASADDLSAHNGGAS
ncbi:hypothetical protein ATSB10_23600 [Dyella thiooxydans]|uniref:Asparagine synthetase domain-containing protein n=1 Tax=Dyella thiooxydans TaxID=445710 RepID=A0A160N2H9_9GAMM|nr:hypothetical protein ATSB10_23600 [Dyella thiooxydans]